jgi:hypothetical protein
MQAAIIATSVAGRKYQPMVREPMIAQDPRVIPENAEGSETDEGTVGESGS